jgi:hypothetical protein
MSFPGVNVCMDGLYEAGIDGLYALFSMARKKESRDYEYWT